MSTSERRQSTSNRRIDTGPSYVGRSRHEKGSRRIPCFGGRQEVTRLTLFTVAPNEDKEALASRNDVASLKAWVVHSPLICGLGVLLVGWRRIVLMRTRVGDEFLRPAAGVLNALLPLLARKRGVGKVV
jgi:hypothetical protein